VLKGLPRLDDADVVSSWIEERNVDKLEQLDHMRTTQNAVCINHNPGPVVLPQSKQPFGLESTRSIILPTITIERRPHRPWLENSENDGPGSPDAGFSVERRRPSETSGRAPKRIEGGTPPPPTPVPE
jgi:hypothetical protein